jgi:hypothetical protein
VEQRVQHGRSGTEAGPLRCARGLTDGMGARGAGPARAASGPRERSARTRGPGAWATEQNGSGGRLRRKEAPASGLAGPGASARAAARGSGSALALGTGRCRSMGAEASDGGLEPEQARAHGWLRRGANGSGCGSRQGGSRRTSGCSSWRAAQARCGGAAQAGRES